MINARKLEAHLAKKNPPILSLVYGQEILLNLEALELLRAWGKKNKFSEIKVLELDKPSDWLNVYEQMQPSFFAPQVYLELHYKGKTLDKSGVEFFNNCLKKTDNSLKIVVFASKLEKLDKKKITGDFLEIKSQALEGEDFNEEIIKRLKKAQLNLDNEALEKFLLFYEGNFLLANQAIKRLIQYGKKDLTSTDIETYLEDLALFSTLQLRDAILQKQWLEAFRIAEKISKSDKGALILINWHLNSIFSALLEMKSASETEWSGIMLSLKIFAKTQSLTKKAVNLYKESEIIDFLQLVAQIDQEVKGGRKGDGWLTLLNYLLLLASK